MKREEVQGNKLHRQLGVPRVVRESSHSLNPTQNTKLGGSRRAPEHVRSLVNHNLLTYLRLTHKTPIIHYTV